MAKFNQRGPAGGGNMQALLKQAQKMQEEMQKAQSEILEMEFTATSGGGAVSAVVRGDKTLLSLSIAPDIIDPEDGEMLSDMIVAAVNEALRAVDETTQQKLAPLAGGMNGMGGMKF